MNGPEGIRPSEVADVGDALVEAGITLIEVPLNSPEPLASIALLARRLRPRAVVGAGTVLCAQDVEGVRAAGGRLIVSPNTNAAVIAATVAAGLASVPGYATVTEALCAVEAGAHAIKLFPAEGVEPAALRAQRAIFPPSVRVVVVGGITATSMRRWVEAGAEGFGLGSALYRAGATPSAVTQAANAFVSAWRQR